MLSFIDIYGFLSVVLRGLSMIAQAISFGGAAFCLLAITPRARRRDPTAVTLFGRCARIVFVAACALAGAEALAGVSLSIMLAGTLDTTLLDALGAQAVIVRLAGAALAAGFAALWRGRAPGRATMSASLALAALSIVLETSGTHAASRPDGGMLLASAEALHLAGVAVWIGGIPFFLMALAQLQEESVRHDIWRRFSLMSACGVAAIFAGGTALAVDYVGAPALMYGTSYGVMLTAKILLFAMLLALGALNFLAADAPAQDRKAATLRTRRFAEVEIGIGATIIFCAASLASLPPARDLASERATLAEIVDRLEPRLPVRLESPDFASLSAAQIARAPSTAATESYQPSSVIAAPRTSADIAWSEYNHHWAGLFVVAMGVLALLQRSERMAPVARNWPLLFLGLAAFLFLRADESVWPLGPLGLIESLRDPEIAQHRLLTIIIVVFGLFEWRVGQGHFRSTWPALVFPLSVAVASAFLLTHSHGLASPKEELLIEIMHTPLAIVGLIVGWARWLQLRLDGPVSRIAGLIWPVALTLAGLMLLFYREA